MEYSKSRPGLGNIHTKQGFGDCQLHVEWAEPAVVRGSDQSRGNSGIMLMSMYEIQVLDAWQNPTYADGTVGGIYAPVSAAGDCRAEARRVADV